jgi:3-oxoacyl-[acyl-carrier-protein] synthase-3
MPRAAIVALGTCVPERVVTNRDLESLMDTSDAWIRQRTGIEERRWVEPGTGASDLAAEAARRALAKAGWQARDVEAIVYATLSPDHFFPGDGCFLNAKLGVPGVPALDVRNQCTGFIYGLSVANAWIRIGQFRRVLVVGAKVHSTGLVLSTHLHADGRHATELWCDAPGSIHNPRVTGAQIESGAVFPYMDGQRVFKHAITKMPEAVREALEANGLAAADLKLLVAHQANLRIAEMVQRSLELRDDQVFNNIQRYGNTTAASIPICLAEGLEARGVERGDLVALAAFGAGFTWASALLRW